MSVYAVYEKKEGGADGGLPPYQALSPDPMPIVFGRGAQAVAMAIATSSMIPAKGLMWEPLQRHSKKQYLPMCQSLQNNTPSYNDEGRVPTDSLRTPRRSQRHQMVHWFATGAPSEELQRWSRVTWVSPPPFTSVALPPPNLPPLPGGEGYLDLLAASSFSLSCTRISCLSEGWSGRPRYRLCSS